MRNLLCDKLFHNINIIIMEKMIMLGYVWVERYNITCVIRKSLIIKSEKKKKTFYIRI